MTTRPTTQTRDTTITLPEPGDPARAALVRQRMAEVDPSDAASVAAFGAKAQGELQSVSRAMLAGVKNAELGPAGTSLRAMVSAIRGFGEVTPDLRANRTLWERATGRLAPMARFRARFEEVQAQVDAIAADLLRHEHTLLKDIESLDRLYDRTLAFHDELGLYVEAGEARLAAEAPDLARLGAEAAASDDPLVAQSYRDAKSAHEALERRAHDLKLTRMVTMQALPSIRLVQENDRSLVAKIGSTLANTVPLWETQLAQGLTIQRSAEAAKAVREASDLTNELLTRNAERLRQANAAVRTEMERGVFDIAAIRSANQSLIAAIDESLQIAERGAAQRREAEGELVRLEGALRGALAAVKDRDATNGAA